MSVIIPVFNKEKYLHVSIESVLNQSYQHFEIVVINDGSSDGSEDIILNLMAKDPRIKYINQKNQGVSAARNNGIELAKGKYISFLDADDYYDPLFLEKMVNKIGDYESCYCGHYFVNPDNSKKKSKQEFLDGDILCEYLLNRCVAHTNSWLICKEFLLVNNLRFEENLDCGEDMLLFSKLMTLNTEIQCVEEYLTFYTQGVSNSLSFNDLSKINKDILWVNMYKDFLNKMNISKFRKQRAMDTINHYRLPALIVYQLWVNRKSYKKDAYSLALSEVEMYINDIKISNGLRSLKLYMYSKLLKFYQIKPKGGLM